MLDRRCVDAENKADTTCLQEQEFLVLRSKPDTIAKLASVTNGSFGFPVGGCLRHVKQKKICWTLALPLTGRYHYYIPDRPERWRSGRTCRSRKPVYPMGTEGSNPSLSAPLGNAHCKLSPTNNFQGVLPVCPSDWDKQWYKTTEVKAQVFPPEQERAFFNSSDDWQHPIFQILAIHGLRVGELTHLLVEDVDFEHDSLAICSKPWLFWSVKTGRERELPLSPIATTRDRLERRILI